MNQAQGGASAMHTIGCHFIWAWGGGERNGEREEMDYGTAHTAISCAMHVTVLKVVARQCDDCLCTSVIWSAADRGSSVLSCTGCVDIK